MGGADKVARQHDVRQAHRARAHRRARRPGLVPRDRRHRRQAGTYRPTAARRLPAGQLRVRPRPRSTGARSSSAATTSPCAAAPPTPRSSAKQVMAEQHGQRVPAARSSASSTAPAAAARSSRWRTTGCTYIPANPGWEWVVANLATVPVVSLALGSVAGLGAARVVASHYSLMVQGHLAGVRRRAAGRRPPRRDGRPRRSSAARTSTAATARSDDVVASEHEAFERTRRFLSYLPSSVDELAERTGRDDDPDRREEWLHRRHPARPAPGLHDPPDHRGGRRRGSFFEIGARLGPLGGHRAGPPRRLAGGRARRRTRASTAAG